MNDADAPAPNGDVVPPLGHPYTHAYRLHQGGRGYVALCRKPGTNGRVMDQRCYEIAKLFDHLPPTGATDDHYISVNTFRRPHRRVASLLGLRATFLDLDYHRLPVWAHATPEQVWAEVEDFLLQRSLPMPTMVVASGHGLHVYWNYHRGLPKAALPRWAAVQQHLCRALKVFGADPNSIDAARVLRIAGTTNTKAGKLACFLQLDDDRDVDFEDLARAVLPLTQHQLQQLRRTRAIEGGQVRAARSLRSKASNRAFVDVILADIDRLIAHRWNGRIPEGHRNTTLFVRGCFLVRRTGVDALEAALLEYGISVCDLELEEMTQVAGSIAKKIVEDGRGYRYSVVGAADDLGITVEEVHAAGLVRLHPADPELEEARREAHRAHDRERKALERRAKGIPPRGESLATSRPWDRLGTSERTWYRRGKPNSDK